MAQTLDKKTRRKAWILLIAVILAMLIPMRTQYKDGGTVTYQAVLYTVTKRHSLAQEDHRMGLRTGTEVRVLFWEVYNDVEFVPNEIEATMSPGKQVGD
ncbi:MAG: hypothetical protein IJ825_06635 [Oscillospiraceae bacterium]|nr:hypothetical protein [Oscillospiraceae bacterium]